MDIEKQYEDVKGLKRADIKALENWIESQPHLPATSEYFLILFFYSCGFDVEKTKKCIEYYYTIRTSYTLVFADRDPQYPRTLKRLEGFFVEPFPQLTPDGYGVFFAKLVDPSLDSYDFYTQMKLMDMRVHVWLKEVGCVKGISFIIDMEGSSIQHMFKVGYFNGRKAIDYLLEGLPVRLKAVHFINPTSFVDTMFTLLQPLISVELRSNLHVHHGDTVFDVLPKNCVPSDFNGTGASIKDLHEKFVKIIHNNRDYFIEDEKLKADESKRIKKGLFKRFGF